jgi:hypothetical protein
MGRQRDRWKPRLSDSVEKALAELSAVERARTRRIIERILKDPSNPNGLEVEPAGKYSERWLRWQVAIPSVGVLTFTPIEQAPPVIFYTVIFDELIIQRGSGS